LELFKNAEEDWAIEEKFSTRLDKLVTDLCVVKCAAEGSCPFFIRCALNERFLRCHQASRRAHLCVCVARSVGNTAAAVAKVPEMIAIW